MKNSQNGFGVMVVLIIIALFGVAGELVYLGVKPKEQVSPNSEVPAVVDNGTQQSNKTYTHPSGAFSFNYPERFSIAEKLEFRVLLNNIEGQRVATIYPQYQKNSDNVSGINFLNINTYKVFKIEVPGQPGYGSKYGFTFESSNPSYFLVFEMPQPSTMLTQKEIDMILNSVSIDQEKFKTLVYKPDPADVARENAFNSGNYKKCVGAGDFSTNQAEQCMFDFFTKLNSIKQVTSNYCDQNPMGLIDDPRSSKAPKIDLSYVCYTALSVYKDDMSICDKIKSTINQRVCRDQDVRKAIKN